MGQRSARLADRHAGAGAALRLDRRHDPARRRRPDQRQRRSHCTTRECSASRGSGSSSAPDWASCRCCPRPASSWRAPYNGSSPTPPPTRVAAALNDLGRGPRPDRLRRRRPRRLRPARPRRQRTRRRGARRTPCRRVDGDLLAARARRRCRRSRRQDRPRPGGRRRRRTVRMDGGRHGLPHQHDRSDHGDASRSGPRRLARRRRAVCRWPSGWRRSPPSSAGTSRAAPPTSPSCGRHPRERRSPGSS